MIWTNSVVRDDKKALGCLSARRKRVLQLNPCAKKLQTPDVTKQN